MSVYARYEAHGKVAYGLVEGDQVRQITGTPFGRHRLTQHIYPLSAVRLLAPCTPSKVLAMALNYRSHLPTEREVPTQPEPFLKTPSAVIGPGEPILIPPGAGRVDEEGELVVVMGRRCRRVSPREALDHVLGYTCGNDVSVRPWQRGDIQWWRAKSADTFAPLGPFIVTGLDPSNLELRARVNGVDVQASSTASLLFDVPTVISFISQVMTLEPGDIIFTGTPGRPAEIKPGDLVEVEIEGIGTLRNPVRGG